MVAGSDAKYGAGNWLAKATACNWFCRPGSEDGDVERLTAALDALRDRWAERLTDTDIRTAVRFAQRKLTPNKPRARPRSVVSLARHGIANELDNVTIDWTTPALATATLTWCAIALTMWWNGRTWAGLSSRQLLETRGPLKPTPTAPARKTKGPWTPTGCLRVGLWRSLKDDVLSAGAIERRSCGETETKETGRLRATIWTLRPHAALYTHSTSTTVPPGNSTVSVHACRLPKGWWRGLSLELLADRIRPTAPGRGTRALPPLDSASDALWGADSRLLLLLAVLRVDAHARAERMIDVDRVQLLTGCPRAILCVLLESLRDNGFLTAADGGLSLCPIERTWSERAAVVADHVREREKWHDDLEKIGPRPDIGALEEERVVFTVPGLEREPGEDDADDTPTWWRPPPEPTATALAS